MIIGGSSPRPFGQQPKPDVVPYSRIKRLVAARKALGLPIPYYLQQWFTGGYNRQPQMVDIIAKDEAGISRRYQAAVTTARAAPVTPVTGQIRLGSAIWGETVAEREEGIHARRQAQSTAQLKLQQAEKTLAEFEGREYVPSELSQPQRPIAMMRPSKPKTPGLTTPSGMPVRGELYRKPLTRQTILKPGPKDETPLYAQPISGRR